MNVCIVFSARIDASIGGVESVCKKLTEELTKRYNVNFFYVYTDGEKINGDATYFKLPKHIDVDNASYSAYALSSFFRRNRIDIIWYHEQNDALLQKLVFTVGERENIRTVSVYHCNPSILFSDLKDRFAYSCFKFIEYRKFVPVLFDVLTMPLRYLKVIRRTQKYLRSFFVYSHNLVLVSNKLRDEYVKLSALSESDRIKAISNPILPVKYSFCPEKKENLIVVVARHVWLQKRLDRIIRVWKKVMERFAAWELIILGDGDARQDYMHLAKSLHTERLSFVGIQDPSEYYKKAKILCMSSSSESFGLVLTEAQQYGCVPIAYRSYSSLDDIIEDGKTGFAVKPFDEDEYIEKLTRLMSDDSLREGMALQAMQSVKKFYVEEVAKQWMTLFSSMLKS